MCRWFYHLANGHRLGVNPTRCRNFRPHFLSIYHHISYYITNIVVLLIVLFFCHTKTAFVWIYKLTACVDIFPHDMIWCKMIWYDAVWYDMIPGLSHQFLLGTCLPELAWGASRVALAARHWASGSTSYGGTASHMMWYDLIWHDTIRPSEPWFEMGMIKVYAIYIFRYLLGSIFYND
jgi:hypothetical protein